MMTLGEVERIHRVLIAEFGGTTGIRDKASLEAALARPFQTFDGNELYPSPITKAASLIESILTNHPFLDGNKRTGYVLMRLLLLRDHLDINATQEEKYSFVIHIATGKIAFEAIVDWLTLHTITLNK
ncbi:MAG: type II toxin-antitoxin system death-on-curing family toxin [Chitinophagaceae bacterium]|nr:type II toxin-antitoxin system death-on-curing family toxin [Chitinophagaceae bacterium]